VVNAASYAPGSPGAPAPLAPGTIAEIFGINLTDGTTCPSPSCNPSFDNIGRLRTTLSGAQVTINGTPIPMFFAMPGLLGIEIPTELTGTSATIQVTVNGQSSSQQTISIGPTLPGIFTLNQAGTGDAVVQHGDFTLVTSSSPAQPGEPVIMYATGLGQVTPSVSTGAVPSGSTSAVIKPTVTIDGIPAEVQYFGLTGCCVGLNQINVVVPTNVHTGTNVPVVVSAGGVQSNPRGSVTIAIGAGTPAPAPVTVSSLNLNQTVVTGDGSSYQGTVVLSAAASSATTVALSSSNPAVVSVPASVTVPGGSTSATFMLTTAMVSASTNVTITASFGGATQTATLAVTPPVSQPPSYYCGY